MKTITDTDLYYTARAAGVLIVTTKEEKAAIAYGRAVLSMARSDPSPAALDPFSKLQEVIEYVRGLKAQADQAESMKAVLLDWLRFAADVMPADLLGHELLEGLRARTEQSIKGSTP